MSEIHRVQRLLDGHIIRASSTVQSFHNAVEELIFNSIDGSCDCVEIFVNLADGSVKIIDNGNGVSIKDMQCIGNWNYTSKSKSVSYGQKGEALAAIIQLSKQVQISSRQLSSSCSITKSFDKTESNEILISTYSNLSDSFCGTMVTVNQLFHCFPVRLRAMRPEVEMNCIKELVRHMSMLHHHINWLVVDCTNTEDSFSERVVCRYAAQASVPKRFIAVHGDSLFATLTEVPAQSNGVFSVQGLMSPPLPVHCHWTKRQQYSFLNNRWLRGSDLVSVLINQLYSKAMAGAYSAGSLPKHYPSAPASDTAVNSSSNHSQQLQQQQQLQRIAKYPNFVLQVTCGAAEYDILSEPDKTAAMFRQPHLLVDLVVEAVRRIFEQHNPDLLPALETAIKGNPHCVNVRAPMADSSPSQSDALVGGLEQGAAAECSINSPLFNSGAALYSINTHPPVSANCASSQNLFAGLGLDECSTEASSPQSALFLSAFGLQNAQDSQPNQQSRKQPDTDLFTPLPTDRRKVDARLTHDKYRRQNVRSAARKRKSADCSSSNIGSSIVAGNVASGDTLQSFDDGIFCSEYTSFYESERGATVNRAATAASGYESLMDQLLTEDSAAERATEEDHEVRCAAAADDEDEYRVRANQFHHFAYSQEDECSSDVAFAYNGSYGVSGQTQQQCNSPFVCWQEAGSPVEQRGNTQYAFYDAPPSNTPWTAGTARFPCSSALMSGAVFEGDCDPSVPENGSTAVPTHHWHSYDQHDSRDTSQCDQIDLYASDVVPPCASPLTAEQSHSEELTSRECVPRESSPSDQSHTVTAIVPQLYQSYVYQQQELQEQQYFEEFVPFESRDTDCLSPYESAAAAVRVTEGAATSSQQLATHVQHRRTFASNSSNSGASCNSDLFNSSTQEPGLLAVDVAPAQRPPINDPDPLNNDFRSSTTVLGFESAAGQLEMGDTRVSSSDATVSLHRDDLFSARLVGQCDSRYILSTVDTQHADGGTGKLLLAVDQHAADERVNLERLAETQQREQEHSFVATNESVTICDDVRCVLEQRSDLFLSWHFEYCLSAQPSPQQTAGTGAVFVLTLLQTCTILDEPLSIHDLLEFVHFVADGRLHFPSTLLRPPAVPRILASRACHSSVRFGDTLDSTACRQLLTSLASTAFPFQCAHGRPSVVPLLDLTALLRKEGDQASNEGEEVAALLACLRKAAAEKPRD